MDALAVRESLALTVAALESLVNERRELGTADLQRLLRELASLKEHVEQHKSSQPSDKERLLTALVEGAPYAKILVGPRGRIRLVNAQTEKLFGYRRDELIGESIEVLVPERFRPGHPSLREHFNQAPTARPMGAGRDLFGRCKDGSEIPIEIGLNPIELDGEALVLAAIVDITERKRAEEFRLIHAGMAQHTASIEGLNRELADASRFKSEFVATMSHELRTPLTAIIGAAELLRRTQLGDRQQIHVEAITESAAALLALINSILDFSKIESGKMDLRPAPFEVEVVLESAAEVLSQLARDKGLSLYTYVDSAIPPIIGDSDRLRQVLLNLLGNAVKFTERGHIVARATRTDDTTGVTVRFEVQDTGTGIAADLLPLLFEPFVQAYAATPQRVTGTGLGLSITKRLVRLMGGDIGVQSEPGSGSLFWFTIRFNPAPEALVAQKRVFDGLAALIISDDELLAEIVQRYLVPWNIASARPTSRADVIAALSSDQTKRWVAIVDHDFAYSEETNAAFEAARELLAESIILIEQEGPLRKPLRQSHLFDAIVTAAYAQPCDLTGLPPVAQPEVLADELRLEGPVLVAEDNTRLQSLLKLQFDELGIAVTFVGDGVAAVEAALSGAYTMVFMDCQMPQMDGLAATKRIRELEVKDGRRLPIVAMTANAFAEDRDACIATGMDDYLSKPVKLADLQAMLCRWSGRVKPPA